MTSDGLGYGGWKTLRRKATHEHHGYLKTQLPDANGDLIGIGDIVQIECRVTAIRETATLDTENDIALVTVVPCALDPHGSPFALHASQVVKAVPKELAP